jgi:hypothetical protein
LHLGEHNLIATAQKVCQSGSKGCKSQPLMLKAIFKDYKQRRKNLNMLWNDFQKSI